VKIDIIQCALCSVLCVAVDNARLAQHSHEGLEEWRFLQGYEFNPPKPEDIAEEKLATIPDGLIRDVIASCEMKLGMPISFDTIARRLPGLPDVVLHAKLASMARRGLLIEGFQLVHFRKEVG
jgi:hypothetical protein